MALNMDEKIQIKNTCDWVLGFKRIDSNGDVLIQPNGVMRITRGEVLSQIASGNKMFTGEDGLGSHARIYIMDKDTRVEADFEDAEGKQEQNVINDDKVKSIFALKTKTAFEKAIKENFVTTAEKAVLVEDVKKFGLNEYGRVKCIESYTNMKVK